MNNFENRAAIFAKIAGLTDINIESLRIYTDLILSDVQDILRKSTIQSEEIIAEIYECFGLPNEMETLSITLDEDVSEFISRQSAELGITENDVVLKAILYATKKE